MRMGTKRTHLTLRLRLLHLVVVGGFGVVELLRSFFWLPWGNWRLNLKCSGNLSADREISPSKIMGNITVQRAFKSRSPDGWCFQREFRMNIRSGSSRIGGLRFAFKLGECSSLPVLSNSSSLARQIFWTGRFWPSNFHVGILLTPTASSLEKLCAAHRLITM